MTIFDPESIADSTAGTSAVNNASIFNNIKALYEDALGYELAHKQLSDDQNIISLDQVVWPAEHACPQPPSEASSKVPSKPTDTSAPDQHISQHRDKTPEQDTDDEFDRLLFRLMKDMNRLEHPTHKIHPFRGQSARQESVRASKSSHKKTGKQAPYHSALRAGNVAMAETQIVEDLSPTPAEGLPDAIRAPLSELVYQQIEHKIKGWIDRNLEQIVEDALRYEETGSRDSS